MAQQSSSVRVLIVDDDGMSRELLAVLLEGEGYAVDSAESGEAALARICESDTVYDVILADLHMPGIAGAQLAKQLRRVCGALPLLLAISGSQPTASDIALFEGFLLKPFRMEEVAAALAGRAGDPKAPFAHVAKKASDRPQRSSRKGGKRPAEWHQSRIPPGGSNTISLSASASRKASNKGMDSSVQQHKFEARQFAEHNAPSAKFPSSDSAADAPLLNETIYRQLAESMPATQLREMYAMCVNDARQRIMRMHTLVASHDGAQFVREAHAIKGGCGMLGATELHRLAAALETDGLAPGPRRMQDVNSLDELSAACDRLERMLGSSV